MLDDPTLTLFIQAGGESRRMGSDKSLLPFHGVPLIERISARARALTADIRIISNQAEKYAFLKLPVLPDPVSGVGPLAGFYAAFCAPAAPFAAVIGCDMPFFSIALLRWQLETLIETNADCAIPLGERGMEPLHAVYRRETCRAAVKTSLDSANYRLNSWFPRVRVYEVLPEQQAVFDPHHLAFINVNSPAEFSAAEETAAALGLD